MRRLAIASVCAVAACGDITVIGRARPDAGSPAAESPQQSASPPEPPGANGNQAADAGDSGTNVSACTPSPSPISFAFEGGPFDASAWDEVIAESDGVSPGIIGTTSAQNRTPGGTQSLFFQQAKYDRAVSVGKSFSGSCPLTVHASFRAIESEPDGIRIFELVLSGDRLFALTLVGSTLRASRIGTSEELIPGLTALPITPLAWNDFSLAITPLTGAIELTLGGTAHPTTAFASDSVRVRFGARRANDGFDGYKPAILYDDIALRQ